jgi:hypothetical protein
MLLEYVTNIFILPLISSIIGLLIIYLYDKFEKKQYTYSIYLRLGILIYVSTYIALYISKLNIFTGTSSIQSGGDMFTDPQLSMPQANTLNSQFEKFKIGIPTF